MQRTLSVFSLGLALVFGSAVFAPAATAATDRPSAVKAQPATVEPKTKAQYEKAIGALRRDRSAAVARYNSTLAAEKSAARDLAAAYEKRYAPVRAELDARYAAMEKEVKAANDSFTRVTATLEPASSREKAVADERAGLAARQAVREKALVKLDAERRAARTAFSKRAREVEAAYTRGASSDMDAALATRKAAQAKLLAEQRAADAAYKKKADALREAGANDTVVTALRVMAVDGAFNEALTARDGKISAARKAYSRDVEAMGDKFLADPANNLHTVFFAPQERIRKLETDFAAATSKYESELKKLRASHQAAKA